MVRERLWADEAEPRTVKERDTIQREVVALVCGWDVAQYVRAAP
jgi:NADH:ubiquinone oxidoreductase subunit F (NADH-binding)